ncbi:uncharacterized protein TNCV_2915681 [Trichonephila clavipes]|nr:uncharacterized protein TNCV_2915681 [Trichonephila clavipes]
MLRRTTGVTKPLVMVNFVDLDLAHHVALVATISFDSKSSRCHGVEAWAVGYQLRFRPHTVQGWTFPKSQTKIKLPVDFPALQPFYRVMVLPESMDSPEDLVVDFHLQRFKIHLQDNGQSSVYRKRIFSIDHGNGTIWLNRRLVEMEFYKNTSQVKEDQVAINDRRKIRPDDFRGP